MEKIKLGTSDLHVSKICLGTMTFGEQNTEAEGHSQLDYALERGINFIDTAELYPVMPSAETYSATESIIGNWLKKSGQRKNVVLATKIAGPSKFMTWIRNGENNFDRKNIRAAVESSLKRLQTDYIDLYQLHWPSRNVPVFGQLFFNPEHDRPCVAIEETLHVLQELIAEGKIRYIGVSNESSWGVSEFVHRSQSMGLPRIVSIQNGYHLANRSFESGLDETCYHEEVGMLAYSPLAFGQLTGKYTGRGTSYALPCKLEPSLSAPTRAGSHQALYENRKRQWHDSDSTGARLVLYPLVYRFNHHWRNID